MIPKNESEREHDSASERDASRKSWIPSASDVKAAHYEIRQKEAFDWPLAVAGVALKMRGSNVESARIVLGYCRARAVAFSGSRAGLGWEPY